MARKSTSSNRTKKSGNSDSKGDSEISESASVESEAAKAEDAPVVIDAEAEDISQDDVKKTESPDDNESPEAEPDSLPVLAAAPNPKQSSILPMIGGGIIAGAIGFLAAYMGAFVADTSITDAAVDGRIDELAAEIQALEPTDVSPLTERIDAISAELETVQSASEAPADTSLADRIDALEGTIADTFSGLDGRLAVLDGQFTALEGRMAELAIEQPAIVAEQTDAISDEMIAAFQGELDTLKAQAEEQVEAARLRAAEVEEVAARSEEEAAKSAARAERLAALGKLAAAVESGRAYTSELAEFDDAPKALTAMAAEGVATLSTLQRDFPETARVALSSTNTVPQDASAGDRFTAFLKRQTNTRSLSPRDGDDVDAILSRADAQVSTGDLPAALSELTSLPDESVEAMEPWIAQAKARLAALEALNELTSAANEG